MSDKWWTNVLNSNSNVVQHILKTLQRDLGIKLLAFDFDLTLVDLNTGGKWKGSVEKLASHVRPCFKDLIGAALENGSFKLCIVTFSVQPGLISKVLRHIFPNYNTDKILIEANPSKINPQLSLEVYKVGKQNHLDKVVQRIQNAHNVAIQPSEIFLFDDRVLYVKIAKKAGLRAYLVNNDVSLQKIKDYLYHQTNKINSNDMDFKYVNMQNTSKGTVFELKSHHPEANLVQSPAWNQAMETRYGIKMPVSVVHIK
ncbi:hypothetical protein HELRODRAFT_168214 [Helobdella robusta]|uniref:FCP1 homology domain-containing protein n=1 Tax=Helobdella robusta TaxID=6412 RepID=T1F0B5_HELRO|nr:hypothetical protein HELRODRAFT_168214 [Helobdella robusta]ESO09252.1 hypothetical protein HELRODRAFT_168214 [Helobdella robusta]